MDHLFVDAFFLIFCGAACIATLALYTRQPLIIAYIAAGIGLGPFGLALMTDVNLISSMSQIGIIFLLFLLGLDMQPRALMQVLRNASAIALISSVIFFATGWLIGISFGFSPLESSVLGMAGMFSSTIIGIKLMPTTSLHHKHSGELMIGLLLIQDFIAILCLLLLIGIGTSDFSASNLILMCLALPGLVLFAWGFVRFVLLRIILTFDKFHEFIFLLAIAWCLGLAKLAEHLHLSAEIGAFIAGISIATSPISQYIAISLKPLRDFFLVMFFFALGAQLDLNVLNTVLLATLVYGLVFILLKPAVFSFLLKRLSEEKKFSWDIGFRLGQISEFSLLIIFIALSHGLVSEEAATVVKSAAILTFIVSSYIVIFNFPNPIAISDRLRRD